MIYCDLNGNESEKHASIYASIDKLQKLILENSQKSNRGGVLFQCSYRPCNFIKTGHHGCFRENFPKFSEQIFFM